MRFKFPAFVLLLGLLPACLLVAQTAEPEPAKNMGQVRLAYFLDYPNEVSISFGDLGTIRSIASGTVSAFSPVSPGVLHIEIKDRFSGKQIFTGSTTVKSDGITNIVILGTPDNPKFAPKLIEISEDEKIKSILEAQKKEEKTEKHDEGEKPGPCYFTFINCDQLGAADFKFPQAVPSAISFQLQSGEQKTISDIPSSGNNFVVNAVKDQDQYDPATVKSPLNMSDHAAYFLIFLFRPSAKGAAAQVYVTDMVKSTYYSDEKQ